MTKRLTNADLVEIKKRAEAATNVNNAGWYVDEEYPDIVRDAWDCELIAQAIPKQVDATFIAHARQDVPALLAEVERLRADLAELICAVYEYEQDGTALMDLAERIDEDGE